MNYYDFGEEKKYYDFLRKIGGGGVGELFNVGVAHCIKAAKE